MWFCSTENSCSIEMAQALKIFSANHTRFLQGLGHSCTSYKNPTVHQSLTVIPRLSIHWPGLQFPNLSGFSWRVCWPQAQLQDDRACWEHCRALVNYLAYLLNGVWGYALLYAMQDWKCRMELQMRHYLCSVLYHSGHGNEVCNQRSLSNAEYA
jgi:hypothetical protein